jgi:hypothetical protein
VCCYLFLEPVFGCCRGNDPPLHLNHDGGAFCFADGGGVGSGGGGPVDNVLARGNDDDESNFEADACSCRGSAGEGNADEDVSP